MLIKNKSFGITQILVWIKGLAFTSCDRRAMSLFPYLSIGDNNSICLIRLLQGCNEIMYVKCLAYSKCSFVIISLLLLFLPLDLIAWQLCINRFFGVSKARTDFSSVLPPNVLHDLLPGAFMKLKQIPRQISGRLWLLTRDIWRFIPTLVWVLSLESPAVFSCLLSPWVGLAMSHLGHNRCQVHIKELVGLSFFPVPPYPSGLRMQLISPALVRNMVALLR